MPMPLFEAEVAKNPLLAEVAASSRYASPRRNRMLSCGMSLVSIIRRIPQRLDAIEAAQHRIAGLLEGIMAAIDDLEAKVAAEETVEASVITLLGELSAELKAALAAGDTTRLQALSAKIDADTAALSAAVTTNTPAAPTP